MKPVAATMVVMNEVLLESVQQYKFLEDAWGSATKNANGDYVYTGLELLLDATRQGNSAYYGYVKDDGCYSFNAVKKGYRLAVHPYEYNTEDHQGKIPGAITNNRAETR